MASQTGIIDPSGVCFSNCEPGQYTAVVLKGEAAKVYEPLPIREVGVISAPLDFYKSRKGLKSPPFAATEKYFDPRTTHVKVNREAGTVELVFDEYTELRQSVKGILSKSDFYQKLGINNHSQKSRPNELSDLLKRHRFLFSDRQAGMQIISDLASFTAEVNTKLENKKDDRANSKNMIERTVATNVPLEFEMIISPFKGYQPSKFRIAIILESMGNTVECWLESIEMLEYFEEQKSSLFDDLLSEFKTDGIAIIES